MWEAYNRFGDLVFTFNAKDLAEGYRDRMSKLGCEIRLVRKVEMRRAG